MASTSLSAGAPPTETEEGTAAVTVPDAEGAVADGAAADGLSLRETFTAFRGHVRPHWREIAVAAVLLVGSGVLGLLQPLAVEDVLTAYGQGRDVAPDLLRLVALVLVAAGALAVGDFLLLRAAERVVLAGRQGLVRHILRLPMGAMRRQAPGDLLARAAGDTSLLRQIVTQTLVQALTGLVMIIGTLVMMAIVDVELLLVTVGVVLLLGFVVGVIMPRIRRAALSAQQSVGEMGATLERALSAFTTVKASGAEDVEARRVDAAARDAYDEGVVLARWGSVAGTTAGLAIQIAFLVVLGVGGARVSSGAISVATLTAFLLYVLYLAQPVMSLTNVGTYFQAARAAVQRLSEVTRLPTEPVDSTDSFTYGGKASPPGAASLAFENITFTHSGRTTPALNGFSLDIPAGGLTAFVGPSGAGKTTALSLIERFYDPDLGRILFDGGDLRDWNLRELRAGIGYVEQDAPVMAGSLRDNLAYAAPAATDEDLCHVLAVTRLLPLLERLGGDLDAAIDHHGTSLSGGERQRVAIARALLRRPRLLLLDEATSQLDAVNEAALREVIEELSRRTTVLVVAHRLSTVRSADRIAVLQDGALRAVGTHTELLRDDILYAELASHQLLG
ncbi:ABC transporter ATP-binding protein [Streptomyces muensis]|uniref:ABC transporter ATP-binding protein/permease n=1 Tax=Streptomyces muensis TaxID=1077944 RepID=A0A9X1PT00_STRM4|nr:ABC transporter ATP-binding protein [Streptomyces muensis]MCF1592912.1 ABC transporter ATP-binding protein/permease [Streptomyces muensis]